MWSPYGSAVYVFLDVICTNRISLRDVVLVVTNATLNERQAYNSLDQISWGDRKKTMRPPKGCREATINRRRKAAKSSQRP